MLCNFIQKSPGYYSLNSGSQQATCWMSNTKTCQMAESGSVGWYWFLSLTLVTIQITFIMEQAQVEICSKLLTSSNPHGKSWQISLKLIILYPSVGLLLRVRHCAVEEGGKIWSMRNSKEKIKGEPFLLYKPIWQFFPLRRHPRILGNSI